MANTAEPFQGNLFGDATAKSCNLKNDLETLESNTNKDDATEEDLRKDSKIRPRQREIEKEIIKKNNGNNESELEICTDLPNLSHHSLVDEQLLTPVLQHYVQLKKTNPERILLYRLGDFFECFFEDAISLSQKLELTLTGKEGGKRVGRVPMAGIPHHAADRYCSELIRKGLSVAICDQLESTPSKGSLLKRDITRVLTPGTVLEEGMLQSRRNNWLAAIILQESKDLNSLQWALSTADISTGEFLVMENEGISMLSSQLTKIEASEVIISEYDLNLIKEFLPTNLYIAKSSKTSFTQPEATARIKKHYQLKTINGIDPNQNLLSLKSIGALLAYIENTNPKVENNSHQINTKEIRLNFPRQIYTKDNLIIDSQTKRNLEINSTQKDGQLQGSLLWAIDRTLTAMGGRSLRQWLDAPLIKKSEILSRQNFVSSLVASKSARKSIRRLLRSMGDLERLAGRAAAGQAGARDIVAIADGIERLPLLAENIKNMTKDEPKWLSNLYNINPNLIKISEEIKNKLITNPPLSITEGGLIHDGVDPLLDGIRNLLDDQNEWLKVQEELERKNSGYTNLKLQYHRTFGYFLAISKAKAGKVPDHWIRRQTLANEERFITPDLKAREGKIFQAKAKAAQKEYEIFSELRRNVGENANEIRIVAKNIAAIDALAGLAEVAATNSYCPPKILDNTSSNRKIYMKESRHPVVEQMLVEEYFQPNDIELGNGTDLIVLTGPNASGKSCYLRQIGLIQVLAQIGSWVPAKEACISIADRVFTRVGAVDDLAAGQSTFMVEMTETACILNQATNKSLVLLDEIGRGTSTFDGLSIAWAVTEFLAKQIQSRTIFATHYHELNTLTKDFSNISNFQVLVEETGKDLFFLHKVIPGGSSRSYGIEAARLAGVPTKVIIRARQVLENLEKKS